MSALDRGARSMVLSAWMALIVYWSSQGSLPIDQMSVASLLHGYQHRIAHLAAFGLLGLLARWTFEGLPRAALPAVLLTSLFGASDEWHQSFTPGRRPAVDDWLVDTTAAALALFVWSRVRAIPWQAPIRVLAPLTVSAMFFVAIGLALFPNRSLPTELNRTALRSMATHAAHSALTFARQIRSAAG